MKEYYTRIEIYTPRTMVWKMLISVENYQEWNPLVMSKMKYF
jgi:hypothetical protein